MRLPQRLTGSGGGWWPASLPAWIMARVGDWSTSGPPVRSAGLSAWELACHNAADTDFAGHWPSPVDRERPLNTLFDSSIGHATGTLPPPSSWTILTRLVTHTSTWTVQSIQRQLALDTRISTLHSVDSRLIIGSMAVEGTVYLLHFERPFHGPMQHYVGFTAGDLEQRLKNHRDGTGCVTTRRAFERGITFTLARTWPGTLRLERQIKSRGPSNYCPLCPRRRNGRESAPSNLIGANGFAEQAHSQG